MIVSQYPGLIGQRDAWCWTSHADIVLIN